MEGVSCPQEAVQEMENIFYSLRRIFRRIYINLRCTFLKFLYLAIYFHLDCISQLRTFSINSDMTSWHILWKDLTISFSHICLLKTNIKTCRPIDLLSDFSNEFSLARKWQEKIANYLWLFFPQYYLQHFYCSWYYFSEAVWGNTWH